jgi:DNA primase
MAKAKQEILEVTGYEVRVSSEVARVSMPLAWDEFLGCDPRAFTLRTVPALYRDHGDAHAALVGLRREGRVDWRAGSRIAAQRPAGPKICAISNAAVSSSWS